jgi:hypothetical protein
MLFRQKVPKNMKHSRVTSAEAKRIVLIAVGCFAAICALIGPARHVFASGDGNTGRNSVEITDGTGAAGIAAGGGGPTHGSLGLYLGSGR